MYVKKLQALSEESGINSWKEQNFYPQQLYQFQGPKSDISIGDEGLFLWAWSLLLTSM